MSTPKRYEANGEGCIMDECPNGEWVRWEDYCETVRRLTEGEPVAVPELRTEYARLVEALPRTPR